MSRRSCRKRFAEPLEPRHLLAGLVKVALVDGNLMVAGDEFDNGFSIESLADPTGERSSLAIIPDETTAINDLPVGVPLMLPAVQLNHVRILPGDGADDVGVRGLSITGGLRIDNRGGHDSYKVASSDFGLYLKMDSSAARSQAELSDLVIRKTADKATPVLFQHCVSGKHIDLMATNLKVGGSMAMSFDAGGGGGAGKVSLADVDLDGRLDVLSVGAPLDVSLEGTTARAVYLKISDIKGEVSDRGSTVGIVDSHFDGSLRVESSGPMDLKAASSSASGVYLKLDDIKGESTQSKHKNEIHIESFSWGERLRVEANGPTALTMKKSQGGEAYLKIKMEDVLISSYNIGGSEIRGGLRVDSSGIVQGVVEDTAVSESASFNYTKIKFAAGSENKSSLDLKQFDVGGRLRVVSSGSPLDVTVEGATAASVDVFLKLDGIKGESKSQVHLADVKIGGGLSVIGNGAPLDVSMEGTTARAAYLKLGDIKGKFSGPGRSGGSNSILLLDSHFDGSLRVDSNGPTNVTTASSSASGYFLKLSDIKGESTDSKHKNEIHIESFSWGQSLRVEANGPTALTMKKSNGGDAYLQIKLENVQITSYQLGNNKIDGGLRVDSIGGIVQGAVEDTTVSESISFNYSKIDFKYEEQKQKSSLNLQMLDIGGGLSIKSEQPLDVTGHSFATQTYLWLKIGRHLSTGPATGNSHVNFSDLRIGSGLAILTGGGDDEVRLERVDVAERAVIRLDGGNDLLSVIDSVFAGPALFDGGAGEDVLTLSNNRFEERRRLLNWEKIDEPVDDGPILSSSGARGTAPLSAPQGRAGPGRR